MTKFYAVKNGRKTGIYMNWEQCKEQVSGFPNAIYKSFSTKEEAENFLSDNFNKHIEKENNLKNYAYIDGSFDAENGIYGSGIVIVLENNKKIKHKFAGNNANLAELRNVAGELEAVMYVMNFAKKNNLSEITIFYDYSGIENWALGNWKANLEYTKHYAKFAKNIMKDIKIIFVKVKAHSGIELNEEVDKLAKESIIDFKNNNEITKQNYLYNDENFSFGTEEDIKHIEKLKKENNKFEKLRFFD